MQKSGASSHRQFLPFLRRTFRRILKKPGESWITSGIQHPDEIDSLLAMTAGQITNAC
jgi:hypothetical protein